MAPAMALNIKNEETRRLAKELTRRTGESMTAAITRALRERLDRVRRKQETGLAERLLEIGRQCAAHVQEPYRSVDHRHLAGEPDAAAFSKAIEAARKRRMSAVNFLEAAIVVDGSRDPVARRKFDDFLRPAQIVIEPVTETQARIAEEAYRDFGKSSGHPAGLNLGDCFAYARHREPSAVQRKRFQAHRHQAGA